jgi:hypothetical protein
LQPVVAEGRYQLIGVRRRGNARKRRGALDGAALRALQAARRRQHGRPAGRLRAVDRTMLRPGLRALLQYHLGPYTLRTRQMLAELRNFAATTAAS